MNEEEKVRDNIFVPMSLCIPRVSSEFDAHKIRKIFEEAKLGRIDKIDIVERRNPTSGEIYKRVFIHFYKWFHNERAQNALRRLMEGKDIKIVCDNPWFWRVSVSTFKKV